jgi:hypothetical protein
MKNNDAVWLRSVVAFCLTLAIFVSSSMVALAAPEKTALMGEISVSGQNVSGEDSFAILNGERAFSGHTFFSNGTISTLENASTVKLGKLGFINLSPYTDLSLSFNENSISGNLTAGQIKVFNNEGVDVNIQTADSVVTSEAKQTGIFTVDVQSGMTKSLAEKGSVFLNDGKTVTPVQTGQTGTTATDASDNSPLVPSIVFAAVVGVAVVYVIRHNRGNKTFISPIR